MGFKFQEGKMYTMPVYFGPQGDYLHPTYYQPADIEGLAITFETDAGKLEALLPDGFSLNAPVLSVQFCEFDHCAWLAGDSYNLINISIPVHYDGIEDHLDGDFILTMFENHADPIVGGRDTIGFSKIYADIPRFRQYENYYMASASSWSFKFLELTVDINGKAENPDMLKKLSAQSQGKLNLKYVPETGNGFCHPDICYPTFNPKEWHKPEGYRFELKEPATQVCSGTVKFNYPHMELGEMTTYNRIGTYLAELPIKSYLGAQRILYSDPLDYTHARRLK